MLQWAFEEWCSRVADAAVSREEEHAQESRKQV